MVTRRERCALSVLHLGHSMDISQAIQRESYEDREPVVPDIAPFEGDAINNMLQIFEREPQEA